VSIVRASLGTEGHWAFSAKEIADVFRAKFPGLVVLQLELSLRHSAATSDVPFIDLARALIQADVRVEVTSIRCRPHQYEFLRAALTHAGAAVQQVEDECDQMTYPFSHPRFDWNKVGSSPAYLNMVLERKEHYFDALRDYFSFLVDHAAGEACYLPELIARLVVFRQQLCSASTDSNQQAADMLDGTIEAFLAAEDGRLEDESYDGLVCDSSQRWLGPDVSDRSRSYSYGLLIGEAALRNGRRSTARMRQLGSTTQLAQGSFEESAPEAANEVGFGLTGFGGPAEQELAELRAENKLLRRQLENHPELFRLCSENRLLREHLATLVQHKASSHQDVDFYQERSKGRLAMDGTQDDLGEKDMSLARTTSRLLSSGEDGEAENARKGGEGQRLALKQFPGIEEVTHLSSDSGEDSDDSRRHESRDAGPRCSEHAAQGADVTSFIPAMSRQVQELFRVKNSME
ncbi:unnamed protein product, partial [Symbiodinium necroappetens]